MPQLSSLLSVVSLVSLACLVTARPADSLFDLDNTNPLLAYVPSSGEVQQTDPNLLQTNPDLFQIDPNSQPNFNLASLPPLENPTPNDFGFSLISSTSQLGEATAGSCPVANQYYTCCTVNFDTCTELDWCPDNTAPACCSTENSDECDWISGPPISQDSVDQGSPGSGSVDQGEPVIQHFSRFKTEAEIAVENLCTEQGRQIHCCAQGWDCVDNPDCDEADHAPACCPPDFNQQAQCTWISGPP